MGHHLLKGPHERKAKMQPYWVFALTPLISWLAAATLQAWWVKYGEVERHL